MASENRKTFRLRGTAQDELTAFKTANRCSDENDAINQLLEQQPRAKAQLQRLTDDNQRLQQTLSSTDQQLQDTVRELTQLKTMLRTLGKLLNGD